MGRGQMWAGLDVRWAVVYGYPNETNSIICWTTTRSTNRNLHSTKYNLKTKYKNFILIKCMNDLEQLLVSICTPDLKCGFAVTRLLSEASGDGGGEDGVPGNTDSPPLTRAVMVLYWWKN
ncbi:hypothetical protein JOQ06_010236 [Pogonophryne albipinna]|uniref:Uncharacterized protein n=1 Tax=Pogonophryne albipinna TaxID=1090488 RepID=A0AAD6FE83_9TELE|nr:hypothetical protein JOQ06_010236 [Pogonophryne albipinna]